MLDVERPTTYFSIMSDSFTTFNEFLLLTPLAFFLDILLQLCGPSNVTLTVVFSSVAALVNGQLSAPTP